MKCKDINTFFFSSNNPARSGLNGRQCQTLTDRESVSRLNGSRGPGRNLCIIPRRHPVVEIHTNIIINAEVTPSVCYHFTWMPLVWSFKPWERHWIVFIPKIAP